VKFIFMTIVLRNYQLTRKHIGTNSVLARAAFVRHRFSMTDSWDGRATILAAGGVVFSEGITPRVAIVRRRRDKSWVLPKGKLYPGEQAMAAAKREVIEETGHHVSVHEFLGSMSYPVNGKIKVVQFWHMRAIGGPVRKLAYEIKAVKWLPLQEAIEALTRTHEKIFLANVGPVVLKTLSQRMGRKSTGRQRGRRGPSSIPLEQLLAAGY